MTDKKPNAETEAALQDSRDGRTEPTSPEELLGDADAHLVDDNEVKVTLESKEVCGLMGDMVAQLDSKIFVSDDPKTLLTSAAAFMALGALLESEAGAPSGTVRGPSEMFASMFAEATRKGLEAKEAEG